MKNKKFNIVLILCMLIFTLVKDFAPPQYFVGFVILAPIILTIVGIFAFRTKSKGE